MAAAAARAPVCVTGASGFIASHIVQQLLQKGYTVHGTVRDAANPAKTEHLRKLAPAPEKLKLFSADLNGPDGIFDEAVQGCDAVFHTATSVITGSANPEQEIFVPGLKGMESVLASIRRANASAGGVKVQTLVLTSSMSSVAPVPEPSIKSEEHWSDPDLQKSKGRWYGATKTCQEQLVWRLLKEQPEEFNFRFVAICPTSVVGPMHQPTINDTNKFWLDLFKQGKQGKAAANDSMSLVDVRDCAALHIAGMENPSASGRYMSISGWPAEGGPESTIRRSGHWNEIFKLMKEVYPKMPEVPPCEGEPVRATHFDMARHNSLLPLSSMRAYDQCYRDLVSEGQRLGYLE